jgi:hypothetical protein
MKIARENEQKRRREATIMRNMENIRNRLLDLASNPFITANYDVKDIGKNTDLS